MAARPAQLITGPPEHLAQGIRTNTIARQVLAGKGGHSETARRTSGRANVGGPGRRQRKTIPIQLNRHRQTRLRMVSGPKNNSCQFDTPAQHPGHDNARRAGVDNNINDIHSGDFGQQLCSSPDSYICAMMSEPPMNSPLMYSCGMVGQLENS